TEHGL
ncbi:hypothetical protein CARUB_v100077011mg, partial [Capsella rubella]